MTAMPLFVMKYIGLERALLLMFSMEFLISILVYVAVLRHFPTYKLIPERRLVFIKKTLVIFFFIAIIQVGIFLHNASIYHSPVVQLNIVSIATLVIVIPFYEEIFYRGCLFGFLCSLYRKNRLVPGVITSLLFCAMHTQYYSFLYQLVLFIISSMLIYIRVKTESLAYPIILHAGMNTLVIFLNAQSFYR